MEEGDWRDISRTSGRNATPHIDPSRNPRHSKRKRLCKNPIFVSAPRQLMVWMVGLGSGFPFSRE